LNGEGPTYGNAQVGLLAMAQRLETFRREVAHWVEQCIFKSVAEWNGFVIEGERGQEELVYPKIKFDDLMPYSMQCRIHKNILRNEELNKIIMFNAITMLAK
jgi:hypothetical protein